MSLQNLAKELEKKGRGKDKMLMHVTPREVAGLQSIARAHGGSLTVNPDTGLVEAGFLDNLLPSLLPMAAGAALTIGSGGALSPLAAAMITGGGFGLATGSVEKGLMAGLGAYGGANLAGGLASAGTAPLEQANTVQAATNAANAGVIPQAPGVGTPGGLNAVNSFDTGAVSQAMAPPAPGTPAVDFGVSTAGGQTQAPLAFTQQAPAGSTAEAMKTIGSSGNVPVGPQNNLNFAQLQSGAQNTFGSLENTGKFIGQNYGQIGMAAAPAIAASMEPDAYEPPEKRKYTGGYRLSPDFQGYTPTRPDPYYRPTGLGYAAGGSVDPLEQMAPGGLAALQGMRDGYGADQTMAGNIPQFNTGGVPKKPAKAKMTGARNMASMDPYEAAMAELNNARSGANMSQMNMPKAGLAELGSIPYAVGGMAGGRYLSGRGDGMSDDIPATINNKQPARLADGEFVVPADVVSHLGNGSSNAGAKKLYGMMDKVRTARTGKKKQAPAVKTDKYMPA